MLQSQVVSGTSRCIMWPRWVHLGLVASTALASGALGGCRRTETHPAAPVRAPVAQPPALQLQPHAIGADATRPPWIAHVAATDLDRDGLVDVIACEAQENQVLWLRQTSRGVFAEHVLGSGLKAPVHAEPVDIDGDGDIDLLVASMGVVFPNNDRIGTVFILENGGREQFKPRAVIEDTDRVTDVRAADFNGDGRIDLALAQFGYDQGSVAWLERTGAWEFRRHVLLELSGAINVCVGDFNRDGRPDFAALVSQQWEEIYLFENTGGGFVRRRIWGSTNEDFGSSGMSVADLNQDGWPDLLFTSGDGFGPAATPGPRPWHGVHWLENTREGAFRHRHIGSLPGAYAPCEIDLDRDGAMDVVSVAAYADWNSKNRSVTSLMWFRNDGKMTFAPHVLAGDPKDQITLAAGDFDGTGAISFVTGGFYIYPPYDRMARVTIWRP